MKTLEVRLAKEADLPALHALFAAALPEVWSMEALLGELQYPYGCLLVALQEGTLVGFADARFVYGDGELTNICRIVPVPPKRGGNCADGSDFFARTRGEHRMHHARSAGEEHRRTGIL